MLRMLGVFYTSAESPLLVISHLSNSTKLTSTEPFLKVFVTSDFFEKSFNVPVAETMGVWRRLQCAVMELETRHV